MVCNRCISQLQNALEQHDLNVNEVALGKVGLSLTGDNFDENIFSNIVISLGFSLGVNKNNRVVEQVKSVVRNYFNELDPLETKLRYSDLLANTLNMSYDNISSIFTAHEKITIENYIIDYRLGLVKNLLSETDLSLTEIAYRIGFSSIHHLSKQFKEVTGITPSGYRSQLGHKNVISKSGDNTIVLWG
jgi:AraC family transcriptional regulator